MKINQKGFGAVEILIVIVVVGALAAAGWFVYDNNKTESEESTTQESSTSEAPSFTKSNGIDEDIELRTDITAVHNSVEAYYSEHGYYPSEANLADEDWVSANLPSSQEEFFTFKQSPRLGAEGSIYTYEATPTDCTECTGYKLSVVQSTGEEYAKMNLN